MFENRTCSTPQASPKTARVIYLMGVSGTGKSTFGKVLQRELGFVFRDGDDLHPRANIEKMASGQPLDDADRAPWLERIRKFVNREAMGGKTVVVACSALKKAYRDRLRDVGVKVIFIHLTASPSVIMQRQRKRKRHFMPAKLTASQFAALETPQDEPDVFQVSAELPRLEVERQILTIARRQ